MVRSLLLFVLLVRLEAGGGPEAVCLLINLNDPDSVMVGERYAELRQISKENIVFIEGVPEDDVIDLSALKSLILKPAFEVLNERAVGSQIDYLVYSTGFPTRVQFGAKGTRLKWVANREGSITGMSFLYGFLNDENQYFLAPDANRYYGGRLRMQTMQSAAHHVEAVDSLDFREPRHFSGRYHWKRDGEPGTADEGIRYLICSMLGVTRGARANTADDIISALERSVIADFGRNDGTFYYVRSNDIRSKVRDWAVDDAISKLKELGLDAKGVEGEMLRNREGIAGLMMGRASFDWAGTNNVLLPGALCENLTSFGGRFVGETGQTANSVFVRAGAAGTSGAVSEPYALQFKFPTPYLFVNYASGLSLGEAYYRSISSPYNLLLLGDPLCQPYAEAPVFQVVGIREGDRVSGSVEVRVESTTEKFLSVRIAVDGRYVAEFGIGEPYVLTTNDLTKGTHRVAIVVTRKDRIATQGRKAVTLVVD